MKRRKFIKGSAIVGATIANSKLLADSGLDSTKGSRDIYRILDSKRVNVGTLPVIRAFAGDQNDYVSPFVLFDEFGPVEVNPGADPLRVDAHPHAGVTPTTYFLKGTGHHKDSLDYDFEIGKGDFMMFNSGRGAIHMEESGQTLVKEGGSYHGFQIWLNTPSKHKFDDPSTLLYNECDHMAIIETNDYSIKVVMGELFGVKSKVETLSPAFYYHINLNAGARISIPTEASHNAFVYNIRGNVELVGQKELTTNQIALYQRGKSDVEIYSTEESELLMLGGEPLNEVVFSYGPFVMNNEQQIRQCIQNYNKGLMGNPDVVNM